MIRDRQRDMPISRRSHRAFRCTLIEVGAEGGERQTIGSVFEEIAELVAQSRTRALMGERVEALRLLLAADEEYRSMKDLLDEFPGSLALVHSMDTAWHELQDECSDSGI